MDCQSTTKKLKINKNKCIGTVVVVVEGEEDEFRLLKHIFTKILDYNYISMKRNKVIQHEFMSKDNKNTVIVANTNNSNIKSIIDDDEYKDKLYKLLKTEYNKSLKNTYIYIIWDRDKDQEDDVKVKSYYKKALSAFTSSLDNDYDMNGLLLLSYPCYEAFNLSNFQKRYWQNTYCISQKCKKEFNESRQCIKDINEKTLLLAIENMNLGLLNFNIHDYDPSYFKKVNETVYRKEEELYKTNGYFSALSLIGVMLVDLGLVIESD